MNRELHVSCFDTGALILLGTTVLALVVLSSPLVGASTRQANVRASVTVPSTCSMTAMINSVHTATIVNGMYSASNGSPYQNGIGKTTLQTFCNDSGGYAIYAVGYTNYMIGNTVLRREGTDNTHDIVTGTATDGTGAGGDVSNWAMKLTAVPGTYSPTIVNGYDSYSEVPSTYTKVVRLNNATDSGDGIGSSVETTYAVYISNTQPAGTYVGQVKYVLVHPGSGAAPETYVMQEIADWEGSLLPGVEVSAVDNRDGKVYSVVLMDDDHVWMTQNLDLDIGGWDNDSNPIVLTSDNTDLNKYDTNGDGTGTIFADYSYDNGVISWVPTLANANTTVTGTPAYLTTASGTTVSGWTSDASKSYMMDAGDLYSYKGTRYNSLELCEAGNHTESDCMHYHVGNYYNWSASVAMSNTSGFSADYTVMPNSICPAGWRLPNGLTQSGNTVVQSDFNALLSLYDIAGGTDTTGFTNVGWKNGVASFNAVEEAPFYYARSGYIYNSSLDFLGTYGYYLSSTVNSGGSAYNLTYLSSILYPASQYSRDLGFSVRCLSR